jgi:hypothetical protein
VSGDRRRGGPAVRGDRCRRGRAACEVQR